MEMISFALGPLLAASLLAAPAPVAPCELAHAALGPHDAPVRVRAYLDPTAPAALDTWLDLRTLVGQMKGSVVAELVIVRKPDQIWATNRKPNEDRVRRWAMSAKSNADVETILREVDRMGWEIVAAGLARADQRAALEQQLGVETTRMPIACLNRELARETQTLARAHMQQLGTSTARPPVFGISARLQLGAAGERLITNDPQLRELGPALELELQDVRSQRPRPLPVAPNRRRLPTTQRDVTRVDGGMTVGGPGQRHHLLVFADSERDPTLIGTLPAALGFRSAYPDLLSVQVVARGRREDAITLRGRLCAARHAGLEMEYLRRLAGVGPVAEDLPDRLDAVAERENCPSTDEGTNDRGAQLDGTPASGADVRQLHLRLEFETRRGALRWFWPQGDLR